MSETREKLIRANVGRMLKIDYAKAQDDAIIAAHDRASAPCKGNRKFN
jgi:hypothetical protein